jgi:hypothetical protein
MSAFQGNLRIIFENQSLEDELYQAIFDISPLNSESWSPTVILAIDRKGKHQAFPPVSLHRDDFKHLQRKLQSASEGKPCDFEPMEPAFSLEFRPKGEQVDMLLSIDTEFMNGGMAGDPDKQFRLVVGMDELVDRIHSLSVWLGTSGEAV